MEDLDGEEEEDADFFLSLDAGASATAASSGKVHCVTLVAELT